jgi:hypothetical protein
MSGRSPRDRLLSQHQQSTQTGQHGSDDDEDEFADADDGTSR